MNSILNTKAAMDVALLVDQYRHKHQAIEKYLDEAASRPELEQALADFYRRQGITDVTPEMIQAGIEAYERNRFTFKGIHGGWLTRKLVDGYLGFFARRKKITVGLSGALAITLLAIPTVAFFTGVVDSRAVSEFQVSVEADRSQLSDAIGMGKQLADEVANSPLSVLVDQMKDGQAIAQTQMREIQHQVKQLEGSLVTGSAVLQSMSTGLKAEDITGMSGETLEVQRKRWADQFASKKNAALASITTQADSLKSSLQGMRKLAEADSLAQRIEGSELYVSYKADADVIAARTSLILQLKSGQGSKALDSANALEKTLVAKDISKALLASLEGLRQEMGAGFKDKAGTLRLESLFDAAHRAALAGDSASFNAVVKRMQTLHDYVMNDLSIRVVDRPKESSAFTRTEQNTQAVRHYVVLEAVSAAGVAMPREVVSAETNQLETVTKWGQRIDKMQYDALKQDKMSDHIVDDYSYGSKPKGFYDISFSKPVMDSIQTRW